MSIADCIQRGMDAELMDRERGERAQRMWREMSDAYERQGRPRHAAEALAAEDVKMAFRKEAGEVRHVFLARIAGMRKAQAEVAAAGKTPDMIAQMESVDMKHRAMLRMANFRMGQILSGLRRNKITGRPNDKAQLRNIVRELHGEASGDPAAKAMAETARQFMEEMRLMFNEAGGIIGKIENWGLPHNHNRLAIRKAGPERWTREIEPRIAWERVEDPLTGRTMEGATPEMKASFLREVYDNIVFGKSAREAVYGRPQGEALYKRHAERRVLHFQTADDWIDYNRQFGTGDPFQSMMGHVHRMARDIVLMREFGPNPGLGVDYKRQAWEKKARDLGDEKMADAVRGDSGRAQRIFRVLNGGSIPDSAQQEWWASFMSSTRHVLTSAFLDRAIIASVSDLNSMRLAASAVGMNPANMIQRHMDLLVNSASREEMRRAGWVAEALADAGAALARFQQEYPASEIAEILSSTSMRLQGLSHWTDMARVAFQAEFAGLMAGQAGKSLDQVDEPLKGFLVKAGITPDEWENLTRADHIFTAGNGATFASPMWWREVTDMDPAAADALFFKIQGLIEEQMEFAVPTRSVLAQGYVDPAAYDLPPGSLAYEMMKSGLMFKSFTMTFTINQFRRTMSQQGAAGKIGYFMNLAAGATVLGALSLQIAELFKGNDPRPMDNSDFFFQSALKGGGFAILGDIIAQGESSWGGGFASYVAGPIPQAAGDIYTLTFQNARQFAMGEDTNFAMELARMGRRYTPMGQTPAVGPAVDRLFWDQLAILLDPEAANALAQANTRRQNLYGNEAFWLPGQALPSRAPDLGAALP